MTKSNEYSSKHNYYHACGLPATDIPHGYCDATQITSYVFLLRIRQTLIKHSYHV